MAQLKMYRFPGTPYKDCELPEGYSISNYKDESDKEAWVEICKNGLVGDDATTKDFDNAITSREDINLYTDVFFLDYLGEHVGTVTAYLNKEENIGDMHMVSIRTDFRGRGLSKFLNIITCKRLDGTGCRYTVLTTDDWRKGAVKGYLNYGFHPVEYDEGMQERWEVLLGELGIDSVMMLYEDATEYKMLYAEK